MQKPLIYLILGMLGLLSACSVQRPLPTTPSPYYQTQQTDDFITKSLFSSDDRTLTEEAIQELLNGAVKLPSTMRLAVYNYGYQNRTYYGSPYSYGGDQAVFQQNLFDEIGRGIAGANVFKKYMPMPSMMVGESPNIVQLREAAVRLQADVLLIFAIKTDIYHQYKVFKKDEAKAYAKCEVLLMDIRTGMIPFSRVMVEEAHVTKSPIDANQHEMHFRATQEATVKVLKTICNHLVSFLATKE